LSSSMPPPGPLGAAPPTPRRRAICVLLAAVHHALIQGESLRTVPATAPYLRAVLERMGAVMGAVLEDASTVPPSLTARVTTAPTAAPATRAVEPQSQRRSSSFGTGSATPRVSGGVSGGVTGGVSGAQALYMDPSVTLVLCPLLQVLHTCHVSRSARAEHAKLLAMYALGARVLVAGYGEAIVQEHVSTGVHAGTIRVQYVANGATYHCAPSSLTALDTAALDMAVSGSEDVEEAEAKGAAVAEEEETLVGPHLSMLSRLLELVGGLDVDEEEVEEKEEKEEAKEAKEAAVTPSVRSASLFDAGRSDSVAICAAVNCHDPTPRSEPCDSSVAEDGIPDTR